MTNKCVVVVLFTMLLSLSTGALLSYGYIKATLTMEPKVTAHHCTTAAVESTEETLSNWSESIKNSTNSVVDSSQEYLEAMTNYGEQKWNEYFTSEPLEKQEVKE